MVVLAAAAAALSEPLPEELDIIMVLRVAAAHPTHKQTLPAAMVVLTRAAVVVAAPTTTLQIKEETAALGS
jgi:hypothetical protein